MDLEVQNLDRIRRRVRACDYLTVAQLFLQSDFLLADKLGFEDVKPRLLGHWGTCHGVNVAYANLRAFFSSTDFANADSKTMDVTAQREAVDPFSTRQQKVEADNYQPDRRGVNPNFHFVLGPGHGFPALQANLFVDGELEKVDEKAKRDEAGLAYVCKNFSWPGGFPSHASPLTPGVICEGGELGYALGAAYGFVLGKPEKIVAVLLGDGEMETASALASLNLVKLFGDASANGRVLPILHLNGYKISAPTLYGRKSPRELGELIRGFGYTPITIDGDAPEKFQAALQEATKFDHPFLILKTEKGAGGPQELNGHKIAGNFLAHQIPLPNAKTDKKELEMLDDWLRSYKFAELFDAKKGFRI